MGKHTPKRETTLNLPPCCFARMPTTGETVLIVRGGQGYHPVSSPFPAAQLNDTLPRPPTAAEIEAMMAGSMFGWDVPGADPARYTATAPPQESKQTEETRQQIEAMLYRAVHGWHLAGADADLAGEAADVRRKRLSIMTPSLTNEP
jgi:hypothetical protein